MQSWKESKALYRLPGGPDVTFAALMQPHAEQTREQANASEIARLLQDTTDIDLSHRHKISGVGQIGNERGRGFFVQTVLGGASRKPRDSWVYGPRTFCAYSCSRRRTTLSAAAREQKRETDVWMRQVQSIGTPDPSKHVGTCSEIEALICFLFFQACQATPTHFLVRAAQNRRIQDSEEEIAYSLHFSTHALGRVKRAIRSRFPAQGMGTRRVRLKSSFPSDR